MAPLASDRRIRVQQLNDEPSMTKQSMADEVDVNQIVARFRKTGMISHLAKGQPQYMDVSEIGDFRQALEHVSQVNEFFMGLAADMRADFNNDPAEFIDWITDPANADEVRDYGLEAEDQEQEQPRADDGRFQAAEEGDGEPPSEE